MEYIFMETPFEIKSFHEMNKQEAQAHFDWYVNEVPNRINLLMNAFEATGGGSKDLLDFTPRSLRILWSWFIPYIKRVAKSEEEIECELKKAPEWLKDELTISISIQIKVLICCFFNMNDTFQ